MSPFVRLLIVLLMLDTLGAASAGIGVFVLAQSNSNGVAIQKLNSALDREAVSAAKSARLAQKFIQEIDYICQVSSARAHSLGLPPPPAGICELGAAAH
jgi:hypothetical protein